MNATVQTILTRKSVRQFTAEPITEAQIDTLLRCAMAAPSAVNSQPWDFIVVTDRSLLDTIGTRYPNTRISSNVQVAIVPCGNMQKTYAAAPDFWMVCPSISYRFALYLLVIPPRTLNPKTSSRRKTFTTTAGNYCSNIDFMQQ